MKYEILPISPAMLQLIEQQATSPISQPLTREILLLDLKLAGTRATPEMEALVKEMAPGTQFQLLRTPDGDELAISVIFGSTKVGIIPMEQNAVIARLMDAGKILTCRVDKASVEHDFMSGRPWIRILVKIYLID
ncbi:MAG: hypothetical protein LIP02_06430 [Bacteroidales bacterium]|nr:hypothetical protein [Bacteroidales bacterium]